MANYSAEVWDDSQGWRDGAWRWTVTDSEGIVVDRADRDYLTESEAHLAAISAQQRRMQIDDGTDEPQRRTDYRQFWTGGNV